MAGAIVIVVLLVVVLPVVVAMSGALVAGLIGWAVNSDVEKRNEGSELIELNR